MFDNRRTLDSDCIDYLVCLEDLFYGLDEGKYTFSYDGDSFGVYEQDFANGCADSVLVGELPNPCDDVCKLADTVVGTFRDYYENSDDERFENWYYIVNDCDYNYFLEKENEAEEEDERREQATDDLKAAVSGVELEDTETDFSFEV